MRLTPEQVEAYRRDGVLPLGKVLELPVIEEAREHLETLRAQDRMDDPGDGKEGRSFRLLYTSAADSWFNRIIASSGVLDAAESILGPNVQYFQDNVFYKPAGDGAATRWHQDNIWWNADPPNMLTIWIALDDVDVANGAVHYVPGSHSHLIDPTFTINDSNGLTYNVLDSDQVDESRAVTFRVPAGHAVMHHCLTVHGAPPNHSDRPRRAYTVHLMQAGLLNVDPEKHPILRGALNGGS